MGRVSLLRTPLARKLRELGLTISDLSAATGLGVEAIENYTRGHRRPAPENLARMAYALGCDPADIYEDPSPKSDTEPS